ncbi:hypothetical protein NDR87_14125 [Nocardia sp. CDC159]|uniref:Uncharacterized protein n=1 Tax=Nocardia pulmonis TaxID=2951408 RepID=A0A9X2E5Z5_9NOCA|nr:MULTISPECIES: hypothetical protein [Nocardia]MCM6774439.1 hypothetical protein [Nocardia pulmonis]MCM6787495.1 hypothetical protein [Nocardia sp. CDC159]
MFRDHGRAQQNKKGKSIMKRRVHFVGSLPAELMSSPRSAMEWILDHSGGQPLTTLPCDLDPGWMMAYLRDLATRKGVLEFSSGSHDYVDYNHVPSARVRPGVTLHADDLRMDRIDRIADVVPAFRQLRRERPELSLNHVKLQLSQPNPLDMALFTFAGAALADRLPTARALRHIDSITTALRYLPLFTQAVLEEIAAVTATHGSTITWQVESPVALLAMLKATQLKTKAALAKLLARQLAGFLTELHHLGAHASLHLCYGDHKHTALLQPTSLDPAVTLLNQLAHRLRRHGTPLPVVHLPCAFGAEPAPLDQDFYTPLQRLDPDWTAIAGVVSPGNVIDSLLAARLFEHAAHRPVHAVSTACGLGRCTVAVAEQAAATTAATAAFSQHWLPTDPPAELAPTAADRQ